jgi:hypothetical protein
MRAGVACLTIAGMSLETGPSTTQVTIELATDQEPIQGRIANDAGLNCEFSGWLGLAAALGEVLKPAAEGEATT